MIDSTGTTTRNPTSLTLSPGYPSGVVPVISAVLLNTPATNGWLNTPLTVITPPSPNARSSTSQTYFSPPTGVTAAPTDA